MRQATLGGKEDIWLQSLRDEPAQKMEEQNFQDAMTAEEGEEEPSVPLKRHLLRFICNLTLVVLYISIFIAILVPCILMWMPQSHQALQEQLKEESHLNIKKRIADAGAGSILFSEAEINRYLAEHCRTLQKGGTALISHAEQVSIDIQDDYAQLVIDRMISSTLHHTVRVHISFNRTQKNGRIHMDYKISGGEPIAGLFPNGGSIGCLPVPTRFMQMAVLPLERLIQHFPDIYELVATQAYLPTFYHDNRGQGILKLSPPTPHSFSNP